jgi:hypothetical protein
VRPNAKFIRSAYQVGRVSPHAKWVRSRPKSRRSTDDTVDLSAGVSEPPYDVSISPKAPDQREVAVRRRVAELSHKDPGRFFAVIRAAAESERDGNDPVTALENALQATTNAQEDSGV